MPFEAPVFAKVAKETVAYGRHLAPGSRLRGNERVLISYAFILATSASDTSKLA